MGADIHSIVEVKQNGVWKPNRIKIFPNDYYREDEKSKPKKDQWKGALYEKNEHPSDGRSYDWFAILADVRNGYGFAGCRTGQGFSVIAEPRGVPDDATDKWKQIVKDWAGDFHSHSYLYPSDFDSFDWNQVTMKTGVITLKEYDVLRKEHSTPESWCGGVSGPNLVTVDEETADKILSGEDVVLTKTDWYNTEEESKPVSQWETIYVQYYWPVVYSEWFEHKIKTIIEPLKELAKKYEDVRYVFAFDN
jgi:hypothetical protein